MAFCQRTTLSINVLIYFYIWGQTKHLQGTEITSEKPDDVRPTSTAAACVAGILNKRKSRCNY